MIYHSCSFGCVRNSSDSNHLMLAATFNSETGLPALRFLTLRLEIQLISHHRQSLCLFTDGAGEYEKNELDRYLSEFIY